MFCAVPLPLSLLGCCPVVGVFACGCCLSAGLSVVVSLPIGVLSQLVLMRVCRAPSLFFLPSFSPFSPLSSSLPLLLPLLLLPFPSLPPSPFSLFPPAPLLPSCSARRVSIIDTLFLACCCSLSHCLNADCPFLIHLDGLDVGATCLFLWLLAALSAGLDFSRSL